MKDYKKILEGIVDIIRTTEKSDIGFVNICAYLSNFFPKLKESEDEVIRKRLINTCQDAILYETLADYTTKGFEECLAWLKKQSDKDKLIKELGKYKVKYTQDVLSQQLEKQGEKPKWSEEDDTILLELIRRMEALDHYWNRPTDEKIIDWLKSLKERISEKPKEEVDGFDAELNALLKKYEYLPKKELAECLEFYINVVKNLKI